MEPHAGPALPPGSGTTGLRLQGQRGRDVQPCTNTTPSPAHGCQLLSAPSAPPGQQGTRFCPSLPPTHPSRAANRVQTKLAPRIFA